MSHIDSVSNGLGAQSVWLMLKGCYREIPATLSITADTGWEYDRLWSNGRRGSSLEYFTEVVEPLGRKYGFDCYFVRAVDEFKQPLPGLLEHTKWCAKTGKLGNLKIPLFGSRKGRNGQACTGKMKIRAINQQLRRLGAKTATTYQGIHIDEASRRVSGRFIGQHKAFPWISVFQDTVRKRVTLKDGTKTRAETDVKWLTHAYPLVDLRHNREICQLGLSRLKIPYLISSECDGCPHKDLARWERTSPDVIKELSELESEFKGEFFFTPERIPLMEAIEMMQFKRREDPEKFKVEADFGCQNAICGV